MSSWGLHDLQGLLAPVFHIPLCVCISFDIQLLKQSSGWDHESTFVDSICTVWSLSVSLHIFLSLLGPLMGVLQFKLTFLCTPLSPDLTSCQSLLLALRPVLLSTELSSFSRLGGITPSPPQAGLLLMFLEPPWGGIGKGAGCTCLDGDGEERRRGWQTSTEGLLSGTSGALSMSMCFRHLAVVFGLCWRVASLVGLGLASSREILLSVSWRQIWQINTNSKSSHFHFTRVL